MLCDDSTGDDAPLTEDGLVTVAEGLGLDAAPFREEMASPEMSPATRRDLAEAARSASTGRHRSW